MVRNFYVKNNESGSTIIFTAFSLLTVLIDTYIPKHVTRLFLLNWSLLSSFRKQSGSKEGTSAVRLAQRRFH